MTEVSFLTVYLYHIYLESSYHACHSTVTPLCPDSHKANRALVSNLKQQLPVRFRLVPDELPLFTSI